MKYSNEINCSLLSRFALKTSLLAVFFCVALSTAYSQLTTGFKYQAVVRDTGGVLITNQTVGIRTSIIADSANGTTIYQETQNLTTNGYGLVTADIGNGTPQTGTFASIAWGAGPHFLKIEIDETGGTNYSELSVTQLQSVPYALFAQNVANKDDTDADPSNELIDSIIFDNETLSIYENGTTHLADFSGLVSNGAGDP